MVNPCKNCLYHAIVIKRCTNPCQIYPRHAILVVIASKDVLNPCEMEKDMEFSSSLSTGILQHTWTVGAPVCGSYQSYPETILK